MRAVSGRSLIKVLVAAFLFAAGPALADDAKPQGAAADGAVTEQQWNDCSSDDSDLSLKVCSEIIDRGDKASSTDRALAHMKRGVSHYRKGEIDAALDDWQATLVFKPDQAVTTLTLRVRADALVDEKRYKEAIADYSRLLAITPQDITVVLLRSTTRALALDYDGAIADAYQASALDPKRSEPYYVLGHVSFLHKDYDEALVALDKAVTLSDAHGEYFSLRGTVHLYLGEFDKAKADFEKASQINAKLELAYTGLAQAARLTGDSDGAVAALTRGIAVSPNSPSMYADRANLLIEAGRDADAAADDLDKQIAINSKSLAQSDPATEGRSEALANRAFARALKGDVEKAIADADEAINLNPSGGKALDARGIAYVRKGDYARAISDFSQAIGYGGDVLSVYLHRAEAHQAFGNYALAIEDYKIVLDIAPGFPTARDGLTGAQEAQKEEQSDTPAARNDTAAPPPAIADNGAAEPASLGKRVALVIGNGSYARFGQLPNPKRDAEKIAQTLRDVGFNKVTIAEDLSNEAFNEALHQFAGDADGADWAVIYYAGHGIEIDNKNYLIPVDAKLASDRDVAFEAVPLERVTAALDGVKGMRLVILDACRENPFAAAMTKTSATRAIGQGLAQVEPESGTLVAYSARAGQVAQDGNGENSPFVLALDSRIRTPGLEIGKLFRLVRDDVLAATGNVQEPFTYGSLSGADLFINPPAQPQ